MKKPKVLILRTAGTNCDYETQAAFELCGGNVERVHINALIERRKKILDYDILVFPGGFSYGDYIASGKILANEIKNNLRDELLAFSSKGRPIIGICNGFQILVKMGLLPDTSLIQSATLSYNDSAKFECGWVYLKTANPKPSCIWTKNLPEIISLPIAHGEGKFISKSEEVLGDIERNNQIVFRYCSKDGSKPQYPLDPNGSERQIAGICDKSGTILGLMPHPERYVFALQHPSRESFDGKYGWGKIIFENAIRYVM
jgi:phosphoribosylformylglycinamidine synthase